MPTEELVLITEGIRAEISHTVHRYAKANNKYMKDYDLNTVSSVLTIYMDGQKIGLWMVSSAKVEVQIHSEIHAKLG